MKKKGLSRLLVRSRTPDTEETLKDSDFELKKTVRHGLPQQPIAVAMDQVQRIIAVGSRLGGIRIYPFLLVVARRHFHTMWCAANCFFLTARTMGQSGIESYMEHEEEAEIQQLLFLVNEGALISVTDGSCLHMWTLRQKVPSVVQKLRFTREKYGHVLTTVWLPSLRK
jgi:syntaxin-binding protein 5